MVPIASPTPYAAVTDEEWQPVFERAEGAAPLDEAPFTANMVIASPDGPVVIDAENALVVREGFSANPTVDSLPVLLRAAVQPSLVAAGPSSEGVVVWLVGKNAPAGGILNVVSGAWHEVRIGEEVWSDFPAVPSDVFVRNDELFVLTSDGLRVFGLGREGPRRG